jgi:hypothetical protein
MGIRIKGSSNAIVPITAGQYINDVVFENNLYINNKLYVFVGGGSNTPDYPPSYITTHNTIFEISYPNNTSVTSTDIKIGQSISGNIQIASGEQLATYNIEYTEGNTLYTAKVTLTPLQALKIYDENNKEASSFVLRLGKKTADAGNPRKKIIFEYQKNIEYTERIQIDELNYIDNLLVKNNGIINSNLAVGNKINDIILYYDTVYTNTLLTDIGFGMFAQFYDSKYTINDIEYELPFFQLSPGLSYATDNIIVSWLADGQLLLESVTSDPITNISFAPRILRYE